MRWNPLRSLPSFLGGVVGGVVAMVVLGAASTKAPTMMQETLEAKSVKADEIRTGSIKIVDAKGGKTRIAIDANDLIVFGHEEKDAALVVSRRDAGVTLRLGSTFWYDDGFAVGASLGTNTSIYKGSIRVSDANGTDRVVVGPIDLTLKASGVTEKTVPGSITIFDEVGNVVWQSPRR